LTEIGAADVDGLETATRTLRALDYEHGGGACVDAVLAQLSTARRLLRKPASEDVQTRLQAALADLHNLAGWILFDLGRTEAARTHFDEALEFARAADNSSLAANIHYRLGRVFLHHNALTDALREFDASGQDAAGSELDLAIVDVNRAWTHAKLGASDEAVRLLSRAHRNFTEADPERVPDWARFFTENDLTAMTGAVHASLADAGDLSHLDDAVPALTTAVDGYDERMARSRVLSLIELAVSTLLAGDLDHGADLGTAAVRGAVAIKSARTADRMRPLRQAALRHPNHDGARELAAQLAALSWA
jgi:tetratricopeptide (TPR) repeat protein